LKKSMAPGTHPSPKKASALSRSFGTSLLPSITGGMIPSAISVPTDAFQPAVFW